MVEYLKVLKEKIEVARAAPTIKARAAAEETIIAQQALNVEVVRELVNLRGRVEALEQGKNDGA